MSRKTVRTATAKTARTARTAKMDRTGATPTTPATRPTSNWKRMGRRQMMEQGSSAPTRYLSRSRPAPAWADRTQRPHPEVAASPGRSSYC